MLSFKRLSVAVVAAVAVLAGGLSASTAAYASEGSDQIQFSPAPPDQVSVGDKVTVTAQFTWSNASEEPAGQPVTFSGPGASCNTTLVEVTTGTDTATCSLEPEQAGNGSWTVAFAAADGLPPASATARADVSAATTTTDLSANPNPAAVGATVTYTAAVETVADSYGAGQPVQSGVVTFATSGGALSGCSDVPVNTPSGTATCTAASASAGSTQVTATYRDLNSGGTNLNNYTGSTSSALTETVVQNHSTTALTTTPPSTDTVGDPLTFVATVTPASASGTVNFGGSSSLTADCSSVPVQNGQATCRTSIGTPGTYNVTAVYSGDQNDTPSGSSGFGLTINQDTPTVTITGTPSPATTPFTLMDALTLVATITNPDSQNGASISGGTITFNNNLYVPSETVSSCVDVPIQQLPDSTSAIATCHLPSYFSLGGGFSPKIVSIQDQYSATYNPGSSTFATTTSSVWSEAMDVVPTTIKMINQGPAYPSTGEWTLLQASVSPTPEATWKSGGHTFTVSALAVTLHLGSQSCDADIDTYNDYAGCSVKAPSKTGTYETWGQYVGTRGGDWLSGAGTWARSTSTVIKEPIGRPSTVTLTSAKNPAGVKKLVTYTAHISPNVGGAGNVSFYVYFTKDGQQTLHQVSGCGARPVSKSTADATCTVSLNSKGTYPIYADYNGGGAWGDSISNEIHEKVS